MRTVAIINQKGGCGKTTTSINLSACLARLGQKTLLVDMDPQGHCGVGLAVPEDQIERTILDSLIEERDGKPIKLVDTIWQIATDFDLSPSNIKLAAFEQMFAGRAGREDRLKKAVDTVRNTYRWCIIDCPPSVGLITFNALRACDEVIVPVETGYFSLHGLAKMMDTLELMREKCGKDILIRVLPTLYDTRTKLAREVLSELRGRFKEYLMESTVNFNTKLKEAASFGQPITEYDPGSRGYKDFVNLARELMGSRANEDAESVPMDQLSRPAELVQRAKQLAQLTNVQFGRNFVTTPGSTPATGGPASMPVSTPTISTPTISTPSISTPAMSAPVISKPAIANPPISTRTIPTPDLSMTPPIPQPSLPPTLVPVTPSTSPSLAGFSPSLANASFSSASYTNPAFSGPAISAPKIAPPAASNPAFTTATMAAPSNPTATISTSSLQSALMTPAPASVSSAIERGQSQFGGRLSEFSISSIPGRASALSSLEEETADATASRNGQLRQTVKTTAQKIEEFYGVKQIGDEVVFAVRFRDAKKVLIAGDFNNWSPMSTPMINRGRPGDFFMTLPLRPGRYRYRFIVDGSWMTDPNNNYVETNQFGELNNVIEVA